jgi:hypothetical protein
MTYRPSHSTPFGQESFAATKWHVVHGVSGRRSSGSDQVNPAGINCFLLCDREAMKETFLPGLYERVDYFQVLYFLAVLKVFGIKNATIRGQAGSDNKRIIEGIMPTTHYLQSFSI